MTAQTTIIKCYSNGRHVGAQVIIYVSDGRSPIITPMRGVYPISEFPIPLEITSLIRNAYDDAGFYVQNIHDSGVAAELYRAQGCNGGPVPMPEVLRHE